MLRRGVTGNLSHVGCSEGGLLETLVMWDAQKGLLETLVMWDAQKGGYKL